MAIKVKFSRPALPDNGAAGKRLKRHGHTIFGYGNGPVDKKFRKKEKWMDRNYLANNA